MKNPVKDPVGACSKFPDAQVFAMLVEEMRGDKDFFPATTSEEEEQSVAMLTWRYFSSKRCQETQFSLAHTGRFLWLIPT